MIEANTGGPTVSVTLAFTEPALAVIVVVPIARPITAGALPPSLLMIATVGLLELQVAEASVCWLPSLNVPVAPKARIAPKGTDALSGLKLIETNPAGVSVFG